VFEQVDMVVPTCDRPKVRNPAESENAIDISRSSSYDQGCHEAGLTVNGLCTPGFASFGAGAFYHFGVYSNAAWHENIVPKLTIKMNF